MTSYSVDTSIRKNVIIVLVIIGLMLVNPMDWLLEKIYSEIVYHFPFIQPVFNLLSILGMNFFGISFLSIFSLLYTIFSKCLWKCKYIIMLTGVPNLNGRWKGKLKSSHKDKKTGKSKEPIDIEMEIVQNWNLMNVKCYFPESNSYSKMISLHTKDPKGCLLGFSYRNDSMDVDIVAREFSGFNELVYKNDELKGVYFTNRGDGTHGTIFLKRVKSKTTKES